MTLFFVSRVFFDHVRLSCYALFAADPRLGAVSVLPTCQNPVAWIVVTTETAAYSEARPVLSVPCHALGPPGGFLCPLAASPANVTGIACAGPCGGMFAGCGGASRKAQTQ